MKETDIYHDTTAGGPVPSTISQSSLEGPGEEREGVNLEARRMRGSELPVFRSRITVSTRGDSPPPPQGTFGMSGDTSADQDLGGGS